MFTLVVYIMYSLPNESGVLYVIIVSRILEHCEYYSHVMISQMYIVCRYLFCYHISKFMPSALVYAKKS